MEVFNQYDYRSFNIAAIFTFYVTVNWAMLRRTPDKKERNFMRT